VSFAAENGVSGFGGLGGMLATCLAFFIAVIAAAAAPRPGRLTSIARLLRNVRVRAPHVIRPRPVKLAELCLLRT
jgi:hypothetical protein